MACGIRMTQEEWRALHNDPAILTASETGSALGVNPWETPLALWAKKRAVECQGEKPIRMRAGLQLQPLIVQLFAESMGKPIEAFEHHETTIFQHPAVPWLYATPDAVLGTYDQPAAVIEGKTCGQHTPAADVWRGGSAPEENIAQLLIQMSCADVDQGGFGALVGLAEFYHVWPIVRDLDLEETILKRLDAFHNHLVNGTQPDPMAGDRELLARLYPMTQGDITMFEREADIARAVELDKQRQAVDLEIVRLNDQREQINNWFRVHIGEHRGIRFGDVIYSNHLCNRRGHLSVDLELARTIESAQIPFKTTQPVAYRALRRTQAK